MSSQRAKRLLGRLCGQAPHVAIAALILCAARPGFAQQNLPPSVENQMAAGVEALKSGDLEKAERIFSDAARQGVKHPLLYHNLGVIAQQKGDHRQAAARFREALRLQPEYGPSRLLLGASLLALGKNSEAVRELKQAARLMPQQPQAHFELARAYEASEDWLSALEELQKLVELAPQEPEYSYQLARAYAKLSGWSYQQIERVHPKSARLQQGLGQEYAIQEKYDLALNAYRRAAALDPKLPELHLAMAAILLEMKRFDEALTEVTLEQKLVPASKAAAEIRRKIEAARAGAGP
jgi:tetratricopeptide (TPR) repeat protein